MDRVIFRVWSHGSGKGDVIACLPDVPANPGHMVMYEHIGQHGEGRYWGVLARTRPAKPEEYAALKRELEDRGYELRVLRRFNHRQRKGVR